MTNTSTIQQKSLCLDYCQHVCHSRTELIRTWASEEKLRQGEHAENLPAFSIRNEILLPLVKWTSTILHSRNQDFALIFKHLGKERFFIVSKGSLVSYVLVLDDTIIKMGWAYIFSIIAHRSVQCLLYYVVGHIIT